MQKVMEQNQLNAEARK
jgi:hypothetical protein